MRDVDIARHLFEISLNRVAKGVQVTVGFADTGIPDWDISRHRQTTLWEWADAEDMPGQVRVPPDELMVTLHPRILKDPQSLRNAYTAIHKAVGAST